MRSTLSVSAFSASSTVSFKGAANSPIQRRNMASTAGARQLAPAASASTQRRDSFPVAEQLPEHCALPGAGAREAECPGCSVPRRSNRAARRCRLAMPSDPRNHVCGRRQSRREYAPPAPIAWSFCYRMASGTSSQFSARRNHRLNAELDGSMPDTPVQQITLRNCKLAKAC